MRRAGRVAAVAVIASAVGGCAGFSQNRLLEPEALQVATVAGVTVLEGTRDYRRDRGLHLFCYGGEVDLSRRSGEFRDAMRARLSGYVPRMVDGRECDWRNDREPPHLFEGEAAVGFSVGPAEWLTNGIAVVWVGMTLPDGRSARWEVRVQRLEGESWYADDVFCHPGRREFCIAIDPTITGDGRARGARR